MTALRHPVLDVRDTPRNALKIAAFRGDLRFSRPQRPASSRQTARGSAFYLCSEFCWGREKTRHKPAWWHTRSPDFCVRWRMRAERFGERPAILKINDRALDYG